jgi:hypothetical protein
MMENKRFIVEYYITGDAVIRDTAKPAGEDIVVTLPVFTWALESLVDLLNQLHEAAQPT